MLFRCFLLTCWPTSFALLISNGINPHTLRLIWSKPNDFGMQGITRTWHWVMKSGAGSWHSTLHEKRQCVTTLAQYRTMSWRPIISVPVQDTFPDEWQHHVCGAVWRLVLISGTHATFRANEWSNLKMYKVNYRTWRLVSVQVVWDWWKE